MRYRVFASRNTKEFLRDPISYVFSLGLPILMLIMMSIINSSIPKEANMKIFAIDHLSAGIAVFSFSFVMLFGCLQVSKDRTSSFLTRLFASPMTAYDFIIGYTLPLLAIALGQCVITFLASAIIGVITGYTFSIVNVLLSILTLMPTAIMFIGFGMFFGSLFSDKVAPPISSMIITLSSLIGGIWMDVDMLGGTLKKVCVIFPFYHSVKASRAAIMGDYSDIAFSLGIVSVYAIAIYIIAVLVFKKKMQSENK